MSAAVEWAPFWQAHGLTVLRVAPNWKNPVDTAWQNIVHASAEAAAAYLDGWSGNLGLTMPESIIVIDEDCKSGQANGRETITALEVTLGALPKTFSADTWSGGRHRVFRLPVGVVFANSTNLLPGVDIKSKGGQIVVEPSVIEGKPYRWDRDTLQGAIAELPQAWVDHLQAAYIAKAKKERTEIAAAVASGDGIRIGEGRRNDRLYTIGASMRGNGLALTVITDALLRTNAEQCDPPLLDEEVRSIAASVCRHEATAPRMASEMGFGGPLPPLASTVPVAPAEPRRITFQNFTQATTEQKHDWAVHNLFALNSIAAIFGPSKAGKSFLVIDLIAAMVEGRSWFGYRVKRPLRVLCVALEGQSGFSVRLRAWQRSNGRSLPDDRFQLWNGPFSIKDDADVLALTDAIAAVGGVDVVVIDTLNRATPTMDENSSKEMGEAIRGATLIKLATGALVVLVHHSGKDPGKGLRGHSSLGAALDTAIAVKRDGDHREWSVDKSKDGADGKCHAFKLTIVDLGVNADGDPTSSCVIGFVDPTVPRRAEPPTAPNQRIVFDALIPLFLDPSITEVGKPGAPPFARCLKVQAAIDHLVPKFIDRESKHRSTTATQTLNALIAKGRYEVFDGWIWQK